MFPTLKVAIGSVVCILLGKTGNVIGNEIGVWKRRAVYRYVDSEFNFRCGILLLYYCSTLFMFSRNCEYFQLSTQKFTSDSSLNIFVAFNK